MGIRELRKLVLLLAVFGFVAVFTAKQAEAVPSFARQTGLSCTVCHTMFPELKPFGRMFKLTGYTMNKNGATHPTVPPLAGMVQVSFTHTKMPQDLSAFPDRWSYHAFSNGNDVVQAPEQASIFYGGQIYGHVGALIQATYSDTSNTSGMDNSDIRYGNTAKLWGDNIVYGITLNNNPTDEDVWNSTPAWGFPYADPGDIAPGPDADVLIDGLGGLVGGAGGYVYLNQTLYICTAVYRTSLNGITAPFGWGDHPLGLYTDGAIPYWRLALTHQWGPNAFEIGTYGLDADVYNNSSGPSGPTNHYRDLAFDAQWQYILSNQSFSVATTYIHEDANYTPAAGTSNAHDHLDDWRINGNYYRTTPIGEIGGSVSYFTIDGNNDAGLYGDALNGNPATHGEIVELDYMPPWHDYGPGGFGFAKFSLQYVMYNEMNGSSTGASDNNTLMFMAWFMF